MTTVKRPYLVKLECVLDLAEEHDINDLANSSLVGALALGLRSRNITAFPADGYVAERSVSQVKDCAPDIERRLKRLRRKAG